MEAKEEPEEVGEERGFFADFIVAQHEGLRIEGKGLKNTLQGIWDGRGFLLNQAALLSTRFNATEKMASVCTYSLGDKFLLGLELLRMRDGLLREFFEGVVDEGS